ncbi:hypothetical protein [Ferrovibrio terrae]|uniref:hypothetical protein n=1 Tax=Ferrovibrio terrae TaxID=2594003 RepID=UPI003137FB8D
MLEPESHAALRREIELQIAADGVLLDQLRAEIRPLKDKVRRIMPQTTTSISLVAADGGNNQLRFDPFFIQLVRVVDSSANEHCLEVLSPTMSVTALSQRQFNAAGEPVTALGRMMKYLGVTDLSVLSHMIRSDKDDRPKSPSWVQVYRELVEWAILFSIVRDKDFASDTLIVFDGLLRSKAFAHDYFVRYRQGIEEGIAKHKKNRRNIYLVGLAKHSKVLERYRLAMALEGVMHTQYPCYLPVPYELEQKAYVWPEYARGDEEAEQGGEINKFVGGKMFLVKFGAGTRDPIWPVDILSSQANDVANVLGYLLADSINGFPVPHYPRCLQKAHEHAALVDFDMDVLQDQIFDGLRKSLGAEASTLDAFRLQDADPAQSRYS